MACMVIHPFIVRLIPRWTVLFQCAFSQISTLLLDGCIALEELLKTLASSCNLQRTSNSSRANVLMHQDICYISDSDLAAVAIAV